MAGRPKGSKNKATILRENAEAQAKLIEATKSDHLESVKATINNYMIDALAEA